MSTSKLPFLISISGKTSCFSEALYCEELIYGFPAGYRTRSESLSLVVCLSGDLGRKTVNGCVSLLRQLGISARQYIICRAIGYIGYFWFYHAKHFVYPGF